ncbi:preprotein translocase subunit YajC [Lactobacillus selangorensis]|nr:preprotein translocase subunit YajC [Lactobacillus selangorensis]
MMFIILMIGLFVLMYFTMIRPQKKQQQKHQEMMSQLKKGDAIVTIGGLHGTVDSLNQDAKTVVIDADGVYLTYSLSAVRSVVKAAQPTVSETKKDDQEAAPQDRGYEEDADQESADKDQDQK